MSLKLVLNFHFKVGYSQWPGRVVISSFWQSWHALRHLQLDGAGCPCEQGPITATEVILVLHRSS